MNKEELNEQYFSDVEHKDKRPIFYDGFDDAIIGVTQRMNEEPLVAYSVDKMVEIMVERDGMTHEDAVEYFDFNIGGGWIGPNTPMFIRNEY